MIIVSGCLILTAVNLIVLIRMAYITKRLVEWCKIYCDIDIGLHEACVRVGGCTDGRAGGRAYATKSNFLRWIVYQIFLPMVLRAREELRYNTSNIGISNN